MSAQETHDGRVMCGGGRYPSAKETHDGRVVAVFCRDRAGHVLQVHHSRYGWALPSGKIELGEAPLEAAKRELKEETGLVSRWGDGSGFRSAQVTAGVPYLDSFGYKLHFYTVSVYDLTGVLRAEPGNPIAPRWAPVHELAPISLAAISTALAAFGGVL